MSDANEMITMSVIWPGVPPEVELTPERLAAIAYSKQVCRFVYDRVSAYGHATVTRYPFGTTMGTARCAYAHEGSASILVEQRSNAGQKSLGMLVRQAYVTMLDVAQAVADRSVLAIDPAAAEAIPPRGPRITDPHTRPSRDRGCRLARGSGTGPVEEVTGTRLYDYVVAYEAERILRSGTNTYVPPTAEEACTMASAFALLMEGDLGGAASLVNPLDYDVVRLADPSTGLTHVMLAERILDGPSGPQRVRRGWGLFVHSPGSSSTVTVEAAYPVSATFSERLAAQLFDAAGARNLLVAGAHRGTNDATPEADEPANVTQDPNSVFQRIHEVVVAAEGDLAVQTLGATGGTREVVVTAGVTPPTDLAVRVAEGLRAADYEVCLYGDGLCTRLPSTENLQGVSARAAGADFVILYPSLAIRNLLAARQALANVVADVLAGDVH